MKKLLKITLTLFITLFIVLGFALPLNQVGNWYQQFLPYIGSQQINDIIFLDSLTGFAVTSRNVNPDTASILKTTNGGDNWQVIFTQAPKRFSKIKFINQNTGFVCGGSGGGTPQIYKTTNAGASWNQLPVSTGNIFWNDMSVLNEDTLWLVDNNSLNGGVYRTINGGVNWQSQGNFGSSNPSHVYMYNARIGFIDGLKKTTNGGLNWNPIAGSEPSLFFDMYFADSLTGWKCHQQMRKTTDGGLAWVDQTLPTGGNILISQIIKFDNMVRDTIWGVGSTIMAGIGNRAAIFRTTNGGTNWLFQVPDSNINIFQYQHIQFINPLKGWAYTGASGVHTTLGGDPVWITGIIQVSNEIPASFKLYQNYPNPFNPKTNIRYELKVKKFVKLKIFDITGKELIDLINREQPAGIYEVDFSSQGYSSGVYFYKIVTNEFSESKKMVLVK